MRVLYVNKVSPRLGGGAEARIFEVGKRLSKLGHSVFVICSATEPNMPEHEVVEGLNIYYVHTCPNFVLRFPRLAFWISRISFFFHPQTVRKIREIVQKENIDIIRDDISPFPTFPLARIGKKFGIPVVATVHSLSGSWRRWCKFYGPFNGTAGYLAENWLRKQKPYSYIISASLWTKRTLEKDWPLDKIIWIPNGIDINFFYPGPHMVESNRIRLLYCGRFVELKAHRELIEVMVEIVNQNEHIHLLLAGDGPLLTSIQNQVNEKNLSSHVHFLGKVPYAEMPELYRKADIYVSPSRFEGFPMTFLEAMASGLPIVSTKIEAVEGLLDENNAILIDTKPAGRFADAVLALATDRGELIKLSSRNHEIVRTKYRWDRIVERELLIYRKLLATN